MHTYLLPIQRLFPGCGITVHNVYDTPGIWWRKYVHEVDQVVQKGRA